MDRIPVTFFHLGKESRGVLEKAHGAGGETWDLSVNNFHRGTIHYAQKSDGPPGHPMDLSKPMVRELRFYSQKGDLDYLADHFIETLMLWYQ